ncbi:DEAD/DEAH box helicase [Texcoconibacillus texcoconensis]|uniref:SNF2 family DNA or RNA helicase n=1 Tax=Texcoconibacillus texcoconensis TaxID=1095777 RepID=A0A840QP02_9BACI|nr:SNF2-related protein [Texcoconibacillus texcoconensis]MBB5173099.1 SNF2 family DNA or RNA helicase [Texcoconibacillus texcoconensis]
MDINITFDTSWKDEWLQRLNQHGPWADWNIYNLGWQSIEETAVENFHTLYAPKYLEHLQLYPHQIEAARTVIEKMNGKAILADEVGLGKTIEAGLILKEYMIRGLAKKVLILTPASLVSQWVSELNQKFFIPAVEQRKEYVWEQADIIVASIDTAKRPPHCDIIEEQNYDFIIVDEAHKLKNPKTKNYQFIQQLKKTYCLLLTATPVQNRLDEVFYLVSLLKPGYLGDAETFQQSYQTEEDQEHLQKLMKQVMVRNRRQDANMDWPKRTVHTVDIEMSQEERDLYEEVSKLKSSQTPIHPFTVLTLQREVCSSREAAYLTIQSMIKEAEGNEELQQTLQQVIGKIEQVSLHSKAQKALELIQQLNDKVIIFTEYRGTQLFLQYFFQQNGIKAVPFRGGFKRSKKDWMKQLFKNQAQVLIATEAGGEGINLQFCHHMINYDLPWNPMRIEQRIGRIHRLGQENDVTIYNFAIQNTVEDDILQLLYHKIGLFENVIGRLDDILEKADSDFVEQHVSDILLQSKTEGEKRIKMENLTAFIESKKEENDASGGHSPVS